MNWLLKGLFRPIANRRYNPYHRKNYILINLPGILILGVAGVLISPYLFCLLLLYPLDYFVFDRWSDKLTWWLIWRHFYRDEIHTYNTVEELMKQYEKRPTPENWQEVQHAVDADKKTQK